MYQRVPGVVATAVGYAQGELEHPSYEMVCTGATGHTEVVQLTYDPKEVSFKQLCQVLFGKYGQECGRARGKEELTS